MRIEENKPQGTNMLAKPAFIMLVEDNVDHAELTIEILKKNHVVNKVVQFMDAESAYDYLYNENEYKDKEKYPYPDVILLDVKLPGMDGFELLQTIKNKPETKRIPVIMLTTSKRDEEIVKGYDIGANSYIVKPVNFNEFKSKIEDLQLYWFITSELPKPANVLAVRDKV
ncbi:MAG: response regulator [Candidatus Zixiibacteriota bacterium]|nr:MAG: response regulator [candidate division Zixibacteria bacterium]